MTPEPRQWYKNSERLPTEEQLKKGVLLWWTDRLAPVLKFELKHNEQDFWWMPADIPPLPKPKELTQAELDKMLWVNRAGIDGAVWLPIFSEFAAAIRADQEAKTTERLKKLLEEVLEGYGFYPQLADCLRAIFAQPTTPTKGTP